MTDQVLIILSTCADEISANHVAETLVNERLAACVNLLPGIRSIYRWQGKVVKDEEIMLVIKTTESQFEALRDRFRSLHPYELPELAVLPLSTGSEPYLAWIRESVGFKTPI